MFSSSTTVQRKRIVAFSCKKCQYFISLTLTCSSTIQGNALLRFHVNGGYTNVPQSYAAGALPILLFGKACLSCSFLLVSSFENLEFAHGTSETLGSLSRGIMFWHSFLCGCTYVMITQQMFY